MKMPHMTFTRPDVPDAPLPPDIAELVAGFSALIELRRDGLQAPGLAHQPGL